MVPKSCIFGECLGRPTIVKFCSIWFSDVADVAHTLSPKPTGKLSHPFKTPFLEGPPCPAGGPRCEGGNGYREKLDTFAGSGQNSNIFHRSYLEEFLESDVEIFVGSQVNLTLQPR